MLPVNESRSVDAAELFAWTDRAPEASVRTEKAPRSSSLRLPLVLLIGNALLWAVQLFQLPRVVTLPLVNMDVAGGLYAGERLLDGERLYVDWIDNNPPTWYLICEGVALIARSLHLSVIALYQTLIILFALAGTLLIFNVIRRERSVGEATAVAFAYQLAAILGSFVPGDFGQREQLFSIFFIPYFVWRTAPGSGRISLFRIGLTTTVAALGTMKPHFLFAALLVETFATGSELTRHPLTGPGARPRWRAVNVANVRRIAAPLLIVGFGVVLPVIALGLQSWASVAALLLLVIPYHLLGGHAAYNRSYETFLRQDTFWWPAGQKLMFCLLAILIASSAILWLTRRESKLRLSLALLTVALATWSVSVQHKYWSYHFAFLFVCLWSLASFTAIRTLFSVRNWVHRTALGLVALLCCYPTVYNRLQDLGQLLFFDSATAAGHLDSVIPPGSTVLFISPSAEFHPSLLQLRLNAVGPWAYDFPLPSLIAHADEPLIWMLLHGYLIHLSYRIQTVQPDYVVFSPNLQALPGTRSLYKILTNDLHFSLPANYVRVMVPVKGPRKSWRVFQRVAEAQP